MTMDDRALSRFMVKVEMDDNGCWLWIANCDIKGYGKFWLDGRWRSAHQVSYEHFIGPIPKSLELDHLCRVRHCVNSTHVEAVSHGDNLRRGRSVNREKSRCSRGHSFDGNTYKRPGSNRRECCKCYFLVSGYRRIPNM